VDVPAILDVRGCPAPKETQGRIDSTGYIVHAIVSTVSCHKRARLKDQEVVVGTVGTATMKGFEAPKGLPAVQKRLEAEAEVVVAWL